MKALLKPVIVAAAGILVLGALPSCSEKAKQERAAESAAETAADAMEDYCKILESIKDKESGKAAIAKMDGLADKFAKVAEKAKKAGNTPPDAATQAKVDEKTKALQDRMTKAVTSAMTVLATDPELAKSFGEKMQLIGTKMAAAQAK